MNTTKTIYFIRHGQAEHNVGASQYGEKAYFDKKYINAKLTDLGIDQCKNVTKLNLDVDIVYTSPIWRTLETSTINFGGRDIKIIATEEIREKQYNHPCNIREKRSILAANFP